MSLCTRLCTSLCTRLCTSLCTRLCMSLCTRLYLFPLCAASTTLLFAAYFAINPSNSALQRCSKGTAFFIASSSILCGTVACIAVCIYFNVRLCLPLAQPKHPKIKTTHLWLNKAMVLLHCFPFLLGGRVHSSNSTDFDDSYALGGGE